MSFSYEEKEKIHLLGKQRLSTKLSKTSSSSLSRDVTALKTRINSLTSQIMETNLVPISKDVTNVQVGHIADTYVRYILLRRGFKVFTPEGVATALDILVYSSTGNFYKCEVKSTRSGDDVRLARVRYRNGKMQYIPYTVEDGIDFFVLVTLENENVFICPFADIGLSRVICCSPTGAGWKYKDRYDLLV